MEERIDATFEIGGGEFWDQTLSMNLGTCTTWVTLSLSICGGQG